MAIPKSKRSKKISREDWEFYNAFDGDVRLLDDVRKVREDLKLPDENPV